MTHVPDRPARSPVSHYGTLTDEECLRYLLAVQQQEVNSSGRPCSSVYSSQEGEASPFLHGVGAGGREFARRTVVTALGLPASVVRGFRGGMRWLLGP